MKEETAVDHISIQPVITVIVPVYNGEKTISACLESICGQTFRDIEIICVDDGSTDRTPLILREYAEKDDRIRIITQQNGGAGAARNNGLQYARGKYLSILDGDDFFESDMLEESYREAEMHAADIVVFGCDVYSDATGKTRPCPNSINRLLLPRSKVFSMSDVRKDSFRLFIGWAWDKLIRTDLVKQHSLRFQELRTTNDMLFVFSALVLAERITVLSKTLAHHRRGEGSLSVTREKSWDCFYKALIALKENLLSYGLFERYRRDYVNYALHFSLWQLNSVAEPVYSKLYMAFKEEWFDCLGIGDYSKDYFYNRHEYHSFVKICTQSISKRHSSLLKRWGDGNVIQRGIKGILDNGILYTIQYFAMYVLNRYATIRSEYRR